MPTEIGQLDFPIDDSGTRSRIFNWQRHQFTLYSMNSDRRYSEKWFHFYLGTRSSIEVKLYEIPDTTLWMTLYRATGTGITQISVARGSAHEMFQQELETGYYYVEVKCEPNVRHLPDGSNMARIYFRALPVFVDISRPNSRYDLGELIVGVENSLLATFYFLHERDTRVDVPFENGACPVTGARSNNTGPSANYRFYLKRRSAIGSITNRVDTLNWPYVARVYVDNIIDITNGSTFIEAGQHTLVVGDRQQVTFWKDDMYCRFDGAITLLSNS